MDALSVLLSCCLIAGAVLLLRSARRKEPYDLYRLPSPSGEHWLIGHVVTFLDPAYHLKMLKWTNELGPYVRFNTMGRQRVLVSDPIAAAQLLGYETKAPRKAWVYKIFDQVVSVQGRLSTFGSNDERHWKNIRKGTAAAFSPMSLRKYMPLLLYHGDGLCQDIQAATISSHDGMPSQLPQLLLRGTVRVTLGTLFEVSSADMGLDSLVPALEAAIAETHNQITTPMRHQLLKAVPFLPAARRMQQHQATLQTVYDRVATHILSRSPPSEDNTALWACLARLKEPGTDQPLHREQLMTEIGMYIVAGSESSASTLGWCLYVAASRPELQQRLVHELATAGLLPVLRHEHEQRDDANGRDQTDSACGRRASVTPDDFARLPYLNAFVNEVMRRYPAPGTSAMRVLSHPTRVGPYTLPAGIVVWPMMYTIHNCERNWDHADLFDPDRWLDTGDDKLQQPSGKRFMPFSAGTRSCIGQSLGALMVRALFAQLLASFSFQLRPDMGSEADLPKHVMVALNTKFTNLKLLVRPNSEKRW